MELELNLVKKKGISLLVTKDLTQSSSMANQSSAVPVKRRVGWMKVCLMDILSSDLDLEGTLVMSWMKAYMIQREPKMNYKLKLEIDLLPKGWEQKGSDEGEPPDKSPLDKDSSRHISLSVSGDSLESDQTEYRFIAELKDYLETQGMKYTLQLRLQDILSYSNEATLVLTARNIKSFCIENLDYVKNPDKECFQKVIEVPSSLWEEWSTDDDFKARLSITLKILNMPTNACRVVQVNKRILQEGKFSDFTIVGVNGTKFKCHKCILAFQSPFFDRMFDNGMMETLTQTVIINDVSEEAISAFLEYLYYTGISKTLDNPEVTFELYRMGVKYDIPSLAEAMGDILLWKNLHLEDLKAELALDIFFFVSKLDNILAKKLASKAFSIINKKSPVGTEPLWHGLVVDKNPEAAAQLLEYSLRAKLTLDSVSFSCNF